MRSLVFWLALSRREKFPISPMWHGLKRHRTRACHAADATSLTPAALAAPAPEALADSAFHFAPFAEILASDYPIVMIWAMNSGEWEACAITIGTAKMRLSASGLTSGAPPGRRRQRLFCRPRRRESSRRGSRFRRFATNVRFDLAANLAALFAGLAIAITMNPSRWPLP